MPLHAIRPGQTWDYTPRACRDDPAETRTVFTLRHLSTKQRAQLMDMAGTVDSTGQFRPATGACLTRTLQLGIAGWRNLRFDDGAELGYETERLGNETVVQMRCLDSIPADVRYELAEEIQTGQKLTEAEKGN